ncbi:unnamed protein product [Agarophyton chilense]
MKHRIALRKLSRSGSHRKALFRNQVTSLIENERIETTVAKAKELRRIADRIITLGKKQSLNAKRRVNDYVQTARASKKVFVQLAPRFADRCGGYTRVLRTRFRRGDCAPMAVIEWSQTHRSILTPEHLLRRQQRKTRSSSASPPTSPPTPSTPRRGLAVALD